MINEKLVKLDETNKEKKQNIDFDLLIPKSMLIKNQEIDWLVL